MLHEPVSRGPGVGTGQGQGRAVPCLCQGLLPALRMAAVLEHGPFLHTPWALPSLQGPLCSSSSPAQGPCLKLSPCAPLRRYLPGSPGALRVAEEQMGLCHRVVPSLSCVPTGINAFPFLSSGSCSLQTPTGPTAWPWPSRTLCGGLGDTRELWLHCKYAPGLCATTQPRAGTAAGKRLCAAWG